MSVRGVCTGGGDTLTGTSTTCVFTLPAGAAAGDVFIGSTTQNTITSTISNLGGCTSLSGPDANPSGNGRAYLLGKTLTSGDISAGNITVTWSVGNRTTGSGVVLIGGNLAGVIVSAPGAMSATPVTMQGVTTVAPNSDVMEFINGRVGSGQTATVSSWGAAFTAGQSARSNTAGINVGSAGAYLTTPGAAGAYGAQSVTLSGSNTGVTYTVAVPPLGAQSADAALAETATLSAGAFIGKSGVGNLIGTATTAATGAVSRSGSTGPFGVTATRAAAADLTRGASGNLSVVLGPATGAVAALVRGVAGVQSVTAGLTAGAGLTRGAAAALTATATLSAAATVTLGGTVKVWNGSSWVLKPIKVWNGASWGSKPMKVYVGGSWVVK